MTPRNTQAAATADCYRLHDQGNAARVVHHGGRWLALDLDAPTAAVIFALRDLGMPAYYAEREAVRLIAQGY